MNPLANRRTIFVLVAPGLLLMAFAILTPIILSGYYSFVRWDGFGEARFVGLANYRMLLTDQIFRRSIYNFFALLFVTVFIPNPLALAVAAVLTELSARQSHLFRTIFFIPAILTVVLITSLWVNLLDANIGFVNKALTALGLEDLTRAWLSNPNTALGSIVFVIVWYGFPWALLFYYSGLVTVPAQLEEAGIVDGANKFQVYTRIIIPYIMPVIQSVIIIDVISCLKQMEVVYLSTGGAPGSRTQLVANYLYQEAFVASRYGYGNTISVVFVLFGLAFTLLIRRAFRQTTEL